MGWTSIYQLFWCELQGYKVLTHCHIYIYNIHKYNVITPICLIQKKCLRRWPFVEDFTRSVGNNSHHPLPSNDFITLEIMCDWIYPDLSRFINDLLMIHPPILILEAPMFTMFKMPISSMDPPMFFAPPSWSCWCSGVPIQIDPDLKGKQLRRLDHVGSQVQPWLVVSPH